MDKKRSTPSFVDRISNMMNNPEHDHIIRWSVDGLDVVISDYKELEGIMTLYDFKSSSFNSLHRQLNQYGFKAVKDVEKPTRFYVVFRHPLFTRDNPERWGEIVRSTPKHRRESLTKYVARVEELEKDNTFLSQEKAHLEARLKHVARMFERLKHPEISLEERNALMEEWNALRPDLNLTPASTPTAAIGTPVSPHPGGGPIGSSTPISANVEASRGLIVSDGGDHQDGSFLTVYPAETHFSPHHYYTAEMSPATDALLGFGPDKLSDMFAGTLAFSDEENMSRFLRSGLLSPSLAPTEYTTTKHEDDFVTKEDDP